MATSTITVPDRQLVGYNVQEICNKLSDVATAAKADIEGLTAASLASTTPAQNGTAAAGNGTTAARSNHVHPPSAQCVRFAADGSAGATTAEMVIAEFKAATTLAKVYIAPDGALTAHDTNYATITIKVRDGAGGTASTVVALTTETTGSGDWTAFTKVDMGALSNAVIPAGAILTKTVAKAAAGVQLPSHALVLEFG